MEKQSKLNTVINRQSRDNVTNKTLVVVSILGIIGGLIGLYMLLGTNVMVNYFNSKQNVVYGEHVDPDPTDSNTQSIATQEQEQQIVDDSIDMNTESTEDRQDLIEYLDDLSEDEFKAFIDDLIKTLDDQSLFDDMDLDLITLQEAYKRAEEEYPSQIDASKRIRLINELNAVDYNYYVVERGDTLGELSHVFEVPMGQFIEVNGIHDANMIRIGEILLVPIEK